MLHDLNSAVEVSVSYAEVVECTVWSFLQSNLSHMIWYLKLPLQFKSESCFKELTVMMSFQYIYHCFWIMKLQDSRKWDQASSLKTVSAGEQSGKAKSSQVTLSVIQLQAGLPRKICQKHQPQAQKSAKLAPMGEKVIRGRLFILWEGKRDKTGSNNR